MRLNNPPRRDLQFKTMLEKLKRIFTKETFIVAIVIFTAIFLAKFPTLYHWLNTPTGYWYPKQSSWYDAWDSNFQVSYIRFGQNHGMMLENTYTTMPHQGVFIYQYYTLLGVLNRFLKLDPFILYHLASIVTSIVLIFVCYKLVRTFVQDKISRISAFIMIVLGGGVGWILPSFQSADKNLAGFTMVNAFERGHDGLSTIFLILTLLFQYKFLESNRKRFIFYSILCGFLSITLHPPLAALYVLSGLLFTIWEFQKKKSIKSLFIPVGVVILFGIYFLTVLEKLLVNPAFSSQVTQNLYSVDSINLLLGFGIISFFTLYSLLANFQDDLKVSALRIFFFVQIFLLLSPLGTHLYFAKGLHVWVVLLSVFAIEKLIRSKRWKFLVLTIVVVFSLINRFYIFNDLMQDKTNNPFVYLSSSEGEAINFISTLPKDQGVISLYKIGNYIPAHSDLRVYYGHKYQTPNSAETLRKAQTFYTSMEEVDQRKFLADNHIDYIYYGWEEANLRKDSKLDPVNPFSYFPVLFSNDAAIVYSTSQSAQLK